MRVLKVKVISLPYISQVLYAVCFTRPRYQVSVYRIIGHLVFIGMMFTLKEIQFHLNGHMLYLSFGFHAN